MRVAIYARYSDDRQNPRSCEDQIALCREHAARRGWTVIVTYQDEAISGFAIDNRPAINAARAAAQRGDFDILLTEDESRISRNLGHLATLRDDLEAAGVTLATLSTDSVEIMHVAFKGAFAQQYLIDLGQKTRRGMAANAARGLATGSRLYGYRSAPGGAVTIVPDEAAIVREIFDLYAGGATGREIADVLNRRGVPGPRGGLWNASTINGSRQRGNGILQTELYAGVKVFGRMDVRKDRVTGKRRPRPIPPDQWKRVAVPELAIVSAEAWAAVAARKAAEGALRPIELTVKRKPGIFTGLLKCGPCGASYTAYTGGRLICAGYRERGEVACANRRTVARADVERTVLEGLRAQMLHPDAVQAYAEAWTAARKRRLARQQADRAPIDKRLAELKRRIDRAVDAILDGAALDTVMKARMAELEAERLQLEARLAEVDREAAAQAGPAAAAFDLHPKAGAALARKVEALQAMLARAAGTTATDSLEKRRLVDAVRELVDRIEIRPLSEARAAPVDIVLIGNLTPLVFREGERTSNQCMGLVVAGGRYSQTHTLPRPRFSWPLQRAA